MATKLAFENVKPGDGRAMRRVAEMTYLTFKKWFDRTGPKDCAMLVLRGMAKEERNLKIKEAIAFLKSVPGFEKHVARLEEGQRRISAWDFTIDRNPWPGPFRDLAGAKLRIGARLGEFSSYPGHTGTIIYGGDANPGCQPSKIRYTDPKTGKTFVMPVLKNKEPLSKEIIPLDKSGSMPDPRPGEGEKPSKKLPTNTVHDAKYPVMADGFPLRPRLSKDRSEPLPEEIKIIDESGSMPSGSFFDDTFNRITPERLADLFSLKNNPPKGGSMPSMPFEIKITDGSESGEKTPGRLPINEAHDAALRQGAVDSLGKAVEAKVDVSGMIKKIIDLFKNNKSTDPKPKK